MAHAPWSRLKLLPSPGSVTEHLVAPAFALELERGGQSGVRVAIEDPRLEGWPRAHSIAFDKDRSSIPLNGERRFWLSWPAAADSSRPLELTVWHLPISGHARDQGGVVPAAPQVLWHAQLDAEPVAASGSLEIGAASGAGVDNLPYIDFPGAAHAAADPGPQSFVKGIEFAGFIWGNVSTDWHVELWGSAGFQDPPWMLRIEKLTPSVVVSQQRAVRLWGLYVPARAWRLTVVNNDVTNAINLFALVGQVLR
jgi:hypothetical protein